MLKRSKKKVRETWIPSSGFSAIFKYLKVDIIYLMKIIAAVKSYETEQALCSFHIPILKTYT